MRKSRTPDNRLDAESPFLFWPTFFLAGCGVLMFFLPPVFAMYTVVFVVAIMLVATGVGIFTGRRGEAPPTHETAPAVGQRYLNMAGRGLRYVLAAWGVVTLYFGTVILATEYDQVLRSREITAYVALRNYLTAQITFSLGKQASVPGNTSPGLGDQAYADNFRNLFYGTAAKGQPMHLIGQDMADAYLVDNALAGIPTQGEGAGRAAVSRHGYLFVEDLSGDLPASGYGKRFALMAIPAVLGVQGRYVYWVDQEGAIYRQRPNMPKGTAAGDVFKLYWGVSGSTPLTMPATNWEEV